MAPPKRWWQDPIPVQRFMHSLRETSETFRNEIQALKAVFTFPNGLHPGRRGGRRDEQEALGAQQADPREKRVPAIPRELHQTQAAWLMPVPNHS